MKYLYFLLSLCIFMGDMQAAFLFKAPRDYIVYNSRFCKSSLYRVTSGVLKKTLHKRCLEAGLSSLEDRRSRLHRQFDFQLVADHRVQQQGFKKLSAVTRDVLTYAVRERLRKPLPEQSPKLRGATAEGARFLQEDLASFCRSHGSFELKKALGGEGTGRNHMQGDSSLIQSYLKNNIDVYAVFPEFRNFLIKIEGSKYKKSGADRAKVRQLKKYKRDFLKVVDEVVRLKLRLHQTADTELSRDRAFLSISNLYNKRKFYEAFSAAATLIDPHFSGVGSAATTPPEMKNLYFMMDIIRRLNLLGQKCVVKRKR